jgi:pimeloyl-ACP methyl ester carboxylesterase
MNIRQRTWGRRAVAVGAAALALGVTPAAIASAAPSTTHASSSAAIAGSTAEHTGHTKPTIVLVHGAWADASSFAPVTARLQHDGYNVLNAPNPLRGLASDADSVAAFVDQATSGPVVLVGHSYGGAVITNSALRTPRVKALVYIDAFAPDAGESAVDLASAKPGSALAGPIESVFDAVQDPSSPQGDPDLYVKRALFAEAFAGRLPNSVGRMLAASEAPIAAGAVQEKSGQPAWKTLPSWFLIGTADQVIPAAEQQAMATRAHGKVETVRAGHLSMLETPAAVTTIIEHAAASVR